MAHSLDWASLHHQLAILNREAKQSWLRPRKTRLDASFARSQVVRKTQLQSKTKRRRRRRKLHILIVHLRAWLFAPAKLGRLVVAATCELGLFLSPTI